MSKLGYLLARSSMKELRRKMDPRRYNGAVFLGLNGIAVKSHGGTDALGFSNAIDVAANLVDHGFIPDVSSAIEKAAAIREKSESHAAAVQRLNADPAVKKFKELFDGSLDEESVEPID